MPKEEVAETAEDGFIRLRESCTGPCTRYCAAPVECHPAGLCRLDQEVDGPMLSLMDETDWGCDALRFVHSLNPFHAHLRSICYRVFPWFVACTNLLDARPEQPWGEPSYETRVQSRTKALGRSQPALSLSAIYLILNNIIKQDHRFIKKRIAARLWLRSAEGALRTIDGYEAMHLIRKGQIRWLPQGDVDGQRRFILWHRRVVPLPTPQVSHHVRPYLQQIPF